jgi:hypothetical protein
MGINTPNLLQVRVAVSSKFAEVQAIFN